VPSCYFAASVDTSQRQVKECAQQPGSVVTTACQEDDCRGHVHGPATIVGNGWVSRVRCCNLSHIRVTLVSIAIDMATKGDVVMADATPGSQGTNDVADLLQTNHSDAFAFSHTETLALELYDQLQELELQRSLLEAQQSGKCYAGTRLTVVLN
jgi:hypothetical protein